MSTTYGALKTRIQTVLKDPDAKTFTSTLLDELAVAALVEVGRIIPMQYTEDITPVAYQIPYLLGTALFFEGEADIEPMRVEVWDPTTLPETLVYAVNSAAGEQAFEGDTGWSYWGGYLSLPTRIVRGLSGYESTYVIRVWGYAPYAIPASDDDVVPTTAQAEQACIKFARVEGLEMLNNDRDLFTQWQTSSGNSDISPAGLMNQLSQARADWRSYSRLIGRLRSPV